MRVLLALGRSESWLFVVGIDRFDLGDGGAEFLPISEGAFVEFSGSFCPAFEFSGDGTAGGEAMVLVSGASGFFGVADEHEVFFCVGNFLGQLLIQGGVNLSCWF